VHASRKSGCGKGTQRPQYPSVVRGGNGQVFWRDPVLSCRAVRLTFRNHADHMQLKPIKDCAKNKLSQTRRRHRKLRPAVVSVLSNTNHEENQPPHLGKLRNPALAIDINLNVYGSPVLLLSGGCL